MKFLCDVHISYKVARHLEKMGYETIHINGILDRWYTKDQDVCHYVDENDMVLITKDADFRDNFFILKTPKKLIKINLGNISSQELLSILESHISMIAKLDQTRASFLIEVDKESVTYIDTQQ